MKSSNMGKELNKKSKLFKFVVLGDKNVGKSSLIDVLGTSCVDMTSKRERKVIGFSIHPRVITFRNSTIKIVLHNVNSNEKFYKYLHLHLKNANAVIIVYDASRPETFNLVDDFIKIKGLHNFLKIPSFTCILIGNKTDIERKISFFEGKQKADKYGLLFAETTIKDKKSVNDAILLVLSNLIR